MKGKEADVLSRETLSKFQTQYNYTPVCLSNDHHFLQ